MPLAFDERGTPGKPLIVFLHGLGVSRWMWHDQMNALDGDFHLIAPDLPGSGESYQIEWASLAGAAGHVADLIRAHGGRAHVVGLSLGGYTALSLLAHYPEVVESALVTGVSTRPLPNMGSTMAMVRLAAPTLRWGWLVALQARMLRLPADVVPLFKRDTARLTRETLERTYQEVLNFSLPPELAGKTTRLLAVAGDHEVKAVKEGLSSFTVMPNAVRRFALDSRHAWNAEHPELFNAMVRAWVCGETLPAGLLPA